MTDRQEEQSQQRKQRTRDTREGTHRNQRGLTAEKCLGSGKDREGRGRGRERQWQKWSRGVKERVDRSYYRDREIGMARAGPQLGVGGADRQVRRGVRPSQRWSVKGVVQMKLEVAEKAAGLPVCKGHLKGCILVSSQGGQPILAYTGSVSVPGQADMIRTHQDLGHQDPYLCLPDGTKPSRWPDPKGSQLVELRVQADQHLPISSHNCHSAGRGPSPGPLGLQPRGEATATNRPALGIP